MKSKIMEQPHKNRYANAKQEIHDGEVSFERTLQWRHVEIGLCLWLS